jgi:O-antigen ligase
MQTKKLLSLKLHFSLMLTGLVIITFLYWPWVKIPYEMPKVLFLHRFSELLLLLTIFRFFNNKKLPTIDTKLVLLVILFYLAIILSAIFGVDPTKSILGNYWRGDGIVTYSHILGFFISSVLILSNRYSVSAVIKTLGISSVALSIISIFFHQLKILTNADGSVHSGFGNPNFLAGYLLVTLPFTLYIMGKNEGKNKLFLLIGLTCQVIAVLLTQSLGGKIGMLLLGFLLIYMNSSIKTRSFLLFISIIVTIITSISVSKLRYYPLNNTFVAESRTRIFAKSYLSFIKRPVLGWGWANFDYAFESVDWPHKIYHDVYVDKAHSNLIEIAVTTGVVGVSIYILIITRIIQLLLNSKQKIYKYLLLSLLLFLFHSQTNIVSISEEIIFWLIAAISTRTGLYSQQENIPRQVRA